MFDIELKPAKDRRLPDMDEHHAEIIKKKIDAAEKRGGSCCSIPGQFSEKILKWLEELGYAAWQSKETEEEAAVFTNNYIRYTETSNIEKYYEREPLTPEYTIRKKIIPARLHINW